MLATNLTTADGLRIYDLEPQAAELTAIAGPEGLDCSAIDMDALPAGCRWVTDEEWSAACERAELLAGIIAGREISEARLARLREAAELGATAEVLAQIRDAVRVSRTAYVMLPAHHYESLSRGRGWCRQGTGDNAVWADRDGDGYRVGPGRWTVGATDGFQLAMALFDPLDDQAGPLWLPWTFAPTATSRLRLAEVCRVRRRRR